MITDATVDVLDLIRRFTKKIRKSERTFEGTPCWEWIGASNSKGYPQIKVSNRTNYAHRVSHEIFIGPAGPHVHHKCLNQLCVNPLHIESTTPELNRELQTLGVGVAPQGMGLRVTPNLDMDVPF